MRGKGTIGLQVAVPKRPRTRPFTLTTHFCKEIKDYRIGEALKSLDDKPEKKRILAEL